MDDVGFIAAAESIISGTYDVVERKFGKVAAFFVGLFVGVCFLALIVGLTWYVLS